MRGVCVMYYYGQSGEDSIVRQFFDSQAGGTYIDIGAHDGIRFSNTYLLDTVDNWRGICVEPHPDYFQLLAKNRPRSTNLCVACGDRDQESCNFYANYRGSLSSLDPNTDELFAGFGAYYAPNSVREVNGMKNGLLHVPMLRLDSILEHSNLDSPIDFISIDVDGSERWTLPGFSMSRWRPRVALMEISIVPELVRSYMNKHNYHFAMELGCNAFYCRDESDARKLRALIPVGERAELVHPTGWN